MLELDSPSRTMIWGPGRYRLLVAYLAFTDAGPQASAAWASRTVAEMDAYFREISAGELRWSLVETRSVKLSRPSHDFHLMRRSLQDRVEFWESVSAQLEAVDADAVLAVVPEAAAIRGCFAVGPRWNSPRLNAAAGRLVEGTRRGAVVRASSSWGTIAHELGHVIGLPDLYDYELARRGVGYAASRFVGPWDLMGRVPDEAGGARPHPMAWTKALAGWITLEEWQPGRPYTLGPEGARAVRVAGPGATSLCIESRTRMGYDAMLPADGVLVSVADPAKTEGRGPLQILTTGTRDPGWRVAMQPGDSLKHAGVEVRVVRCDQQGYLVEIEDGAGAA